MTKAILQLRRFAVLLALSVCVLSATYAHADILDLSGAPVDQSSIHGGNALFVGTHAFDNDPATRWASDFPNTEQWLTVDMGSDQILSSIVIDWETANATDYTVRTRTNAQGFSSDPADWTVVATVTGHEGLPGGGAQGDDDTIDFVAGTISLSPAGGSGTVDVLNPSGQYLMIQTSDYSTTCCGGASIWAVTVEAVPEPSSIILGMIGLAGLGIVGLRRRSSRC